MYVIGIKRVANAFGEKLSSPEWRYIGRIQREFDFTIIEHAIYLSNFDDALEWYRRHRDIVRKLKDRYKLEYDPSSLTVTQVIFKPSKKLN